MTSTMKLWNTGERNGDTKGYKNISHVCALQDLQTSMQSQLKCNDILHRTTKKS
jgi:hypothetical protein